MKSVGILGTGMYVPKKVLTNFDLEKMVDTSDEWIVTRTGIRERRIASKDENASDLAVKAAEQALEQAGLSAEDIDMIIVATITPDWACPATACIVQERIGARHAATFDLSAACTGFIYGITTASQFIATGMYRHVLVIGVDLLSRVVDWSDRSTCILFGDGAGAAVLGPVKEGYGFLSFDLGGDGSGGKLLTIPVGTGPEVAIDMNGQEVFKFAVRMVGNTTERALTKAGLGKDQIDLFVPHQANIRIIESAMKRFGLPKEKVVINVDRYGNMSAASIPIALHEAITEKRLHMGDIVVLCGFGGGLTWGTAVLKWSME